MSKILQFPGAERQQEAAPPSRASRLIEGLSALGALTTCTNRVRAAVMARQTATLQQWVQDSVDGVDVDFARDQLTAALRTLVGHGR